MIRPELRSVEIGTSIFKAQLQVKKQKKISLLHSFSIICFSAAPGNSFGKYLSFQSIFPPTLTR